MRIYLSRAIGCLAACFFLACSGDEATGDKGPTGDIGPVGAKGAAGEPGPAGEKGATGDKGPTGNVGAAGAAGEDGDKGATGDKGPTGDPGTVTSAHAFAANTGEWTIAVVLGGTNVPLPNNQNLSSGVTINGSNDTLTLTNAGTYLFTYNVNLKASLLMTTQLAVNGAVLPASAIRSSIARSSFSASVVATVQAGSTVSLQLAGLLGAAVLEGGQGAALTIMRLR
jgi:BclA C-terminal domain/Collagen triple helix repeat (20 copies)